MKKLSELIRQADNYQVIGDPNPRVNDLFIDSRSVRPGSLFCAMKGTRADGHTFISQAIKQGAQVILCENLPDQLDPNITYVQADDIRSVLGFVAAEFFDSPSEQMKIIGVTGTNGKTSIVTWLYHMVQSLGYAAGLISTVKIVINGEEFPSTHTTPDVISINRYLSTMVDAGCAYAFMEVSSHALDQQRTSGIQFLGAVFTNLTRDHLDYHPDFKQYLQSKKRLFDQLQPSAFALVNLDDKNGQVMVQNCRADISGYALKRPADFKAKVMEQHPDGMLLVIDHQELWVPVIGEYNAQNLAAVYGTARLLKLDQVSVLTALSVLRPVEGRLETIALGRDITGIVDYAHTPDALSNVLKALNGVKSSGSRIITVVGAGGDRDPGKRPKMTQAALAASDQVILTSDNPRNEDPEKILDDMESGIDPAEDIRVLRITDRLAAIKTAVTLAQPGDMILVAGKGHETYQEVGGVRHPFDDAAELDKLKYKE